MSRMTLQQWQERNVPRLSKASIKQRRMELISKAVRKYMLDKGFVIKKPPKEKKVWAYKYAVLTGTVLAHTRSEARAEVKKATGYKTLNLPLTLYTVDGPEPTVGTTVA